MPKGPRLREKLTYSNVMSTLCFFLLLSGGAAYAASQLGKNSVGSKQLKKNAVTTAKIKKEAVTAVKVKKGTLTGTQINASTLGTVPNAQTAETANAVAPSEPWHEVGTPGEPQFENGCQGAPPELDNATTAFYKDREGVVHLKGEFSCPSPGRGFRLPAGYQPGHFEAFPVAFGGELKIISIFGGIGSGPGVDSTNSGAVNCGLEKQQCFLNGITFRAES